MTQNPAEKIGFSTHPSHSDTILMGPYNRE